MRIFRPLLHRTMTLLWGGQLLSNFGDELSKVASVWLAAQVWGNGAGYVSALSAGAALAGATLGARFADRLPLRALLIRADVVRALAALSLPVGVAAGVPAVWLLLPMVIVCSGLASLFEPALRSLIPSAAPSRDLLPASTALVESTSRFARVLGPGTVAAAGAVLPMVHFFTVDAATYLLSAASLARIPREVFGRAEAGGPPASPTSTAPLPPEEGVAPPAAPRDGGVLRLVSGDPLIRFVLWSTTISTAAWHLVLPLGIGLLVHHRAPTDVSALGAVLVAYGAGNLGANLLAGNLSLVRPERTFFAGRLLAGTGFLVMALAPSTPMMMAGAALAATGGPLYDVAYLALLQRRYAARDVGRIYRLTSAAGYGGLLALTVVSPPLFDAFGVPAVVAGCAVAIFAAGAWGLLRHAR